MVVRTRFRRILYPLALYAMSAGVTTYFIYHAMNGDRGKKAGIAYVDEMRSLAGQLADLKLEKQAIALRVSEFQSDSVDKDLLDEEARRLLGRAHHNELVVMTNVAN